LDDCKCGYRSFNQEVKRHLFVEQGVME